MAVVYILYSSSLDRYYIGSTLDLDIRLNQHLANDFPGSYTGKAKDWEVFLCFENLDYQQARKIEFHIKAMKSRRYIENLKQFPEMVARLVAKFS
ncbi:MAG TPA: GIY-YIG nuclease family protein [Chitinophagaceae bacterium]|nr:GIY-YIG nuclease family protein [Chitinophagaceae bacterium]